MELPRSVSRNKIEIFWTLRNLFKSVHLSSTKAAALKKAKNVTMCLALDVQWSSPSNAVMLGVKSAMMRWHKSAPPSIPGVLDWDEGRDLWAMQGCPAEDVSQSAHRALLDRVFGSLHDDWWEIWFGICGLNIKKFILQNKQDLVWKRTLNKM